MSDNNDNKIDKSDNPTILTGADHVDWQKEYWGLLKMIRNLGLNMSVTANNIEAKMEERLNPEMKAQREALEREKGVQGPGIQP